MATQTEKPLALKKLVDTFQRNKEHYSIQGYKEQQLRMDFVDKFFALFDWDVSNEEGVIEEFRDVRIEDNVEIQGNQKNPDYSFRIGNEIVFFVETKKPSVNIKEDIHPAFQLRRYGYTAKRKISVLTDFHEFAIYDTSVKPNKNDKASVARLFYCTYEEYEKNWDFLYGLLAKDNVKKGSINNYIGKGTKKGSSEVDKEFLKLIEGWRSELAKNIAINNKKLDIDSLNLAVQKIIDRIIFLRICEEKGIEQYENLHSIACEKSAYEKLVLYFDKANKKYNSELFKPDEQANALNIDDDVLQDIIINLYYPECPYAFSVLPVEILGNIYEQFLGKTIRLTDSHQAKIEEKPEVRKAGGVYYTPKYIVDYIVANTVGEKVKGLSPKGIEKIKILDPACGSGSFLLGAFTSLLIYHLAYYTKKDNLAKALKNEAIYPYKKDSYRLTIKTKQSILLNNIYGVDIDAQAVEVTKLSLMLKLLEGESDESAGKLFKYSETKLLPTLSKNIKCGNSLIGPDFYKVNLQLFDDKELKKKINVFDWNDKDEGFGEIMTNNGFDCVIGNPPYMLLQTLDKPVEATLKSIYKTAKYKGDTFGLFIEKSLILAKPKGMTALIVPYTWLSIEQHYELRKLMLEAGIKIIIDLPQKVFENASLDTTIVVIDKAYHGDNIQIGECLENVIKITHKTLASLSKNNEYLEINLNVSEDDLAILSKIKNDAQPIQKYFDVSQGYIPYRRSDLIAAYGEKKGNDIVDKRLWHSNKKVSSEYKQEIQGRDLKRYYYTESNQYIKYGKHLAGYVDPKFFTGPRILVMEVTRGDYYKITSCYVEKEFCNTPSIINIIHPEKNKKMLLYLMALLNSRLFTWYHLKVHSKSHANTSIPKILVREIKNIPFIYKEDKLSEQIEMMTKKVIQLKKNKESADLLEKQIDKLIYEVYDLSPEEIKVVEETNE